MIAKTSESTVSSSSAAAADPKTRNEDSLFYELDPSELLKHLLVTSSCETVQGDSQRKKSVNQATSKNGFAVTQASRQINTASLLEDCDCASTSQPETVKSSLNLKDGGMETCNEYGATMCGCEVQFSNFDFEELPRELLENKSMEFFLLEAQKSMCVESPPSSSSSECWEFAELQNVAPGPGAEEIRLSGSAMNGNEQHCDDERSTDGGDSVESDDSDVDDAMVLVPAGRSQLLCTIIIISTVLNN